MFVICTKIQFELQKPNIIIFNNNIFGNTYETQNIKQL